MTKVTKIDVSITSMQAIATLDNGDRHAFLLHKDAKRATNEIVGDAKSGKLGLYLSLYEGDTEEQITGTLGEAQDWHTVYTA